jgi:superfamily II RNA helicase
MFGLSGNNPLYQSPRLTKQAVAFQTAAKPDQTVRPPRPPQPALVSSLAWQAWTLPRFGGNSADFRPNTSARTHKQQAGFTVDQFEASLQNRGISRLEPFQRQAMQKMMNGRNVLVCAPTGSGKTLIAEYGMMKAMEEGKTVFYTTPRKALCNDKYHELVAKYGENQVGLLTGDTVIHRDAPIVVMTTEVFRDMLYSPNTPENRQMLDQLGLWVDDECHSIGTERDRGQVWEVCMMSGLLDVIPNTQQLHLSATVGNAEQLLGWLNSLKPNATELVVSTERPVPLKHWLINESGKLEPFERDSTNTVNRSQYNGLALYDVPQATGSRNGGKSGSRKSHNGRRDTTRYDSPVFYRSSAASGNGSKAPQGSAASLDKVIDRLQRREMLPAIVFAFSRRQCDKAALSLQQNPDLWYGLVDDDEQQQIRHIIQETLGLNPWAPQNKQHWIHSLHIGQPNDGPTLPFLDALTQGVATHHGGMLTTARQLVETLMREGLIKAVFATDTLALGIHVPAKTVVISQYERNKVPVTGGEIHQMAGRAGRRGLFNEGNVVFMPPNGTLPLSELHRMVHDKAPPIQSQFRVTPEYVLNQLLTHTPDQVRALLDKSFSAYQRREQMAAQTPAGTARAVQKTVRPFEQDFQRMTGYLQATGFLDERNRPTELGRLAASIPSDYNLALAKAIESGNLDNLSPATLAGVLSTTMSGEHYISEGVSLLEATPLAKGMNHLQRELESLLLREDVPSKGCLPNSINRQFAEMVEAWCKTGNWHDVCRSGSYEGNNEQVIRRTATLAAHLADRPSPLISETLAANAQIALDRLQQGPAWSNPRTRQT